MEYLLQCHPCPRECKVNRLEGETGFCNDTSTLKVASYNAHFPEIDRYVSGADYQEVVREARRNGLVNLDVD